MLRDGVATQSRRWRFPLLGRDYDIAAIRAQLPAAAFPVNDQDGDVCLGGTRLDECATEILARGMAQLAIGEINRTAGILFGDIFKPVQLSGTTIELAGDGTAVRHSRAIFLSSLTISAAADPTVLDGESCTRPTLHQASG
ncbi:MAG: hypothetical protein WAS21_20520 [Geminicoccaceae bacterium]